MPVRLVQEVMSAVDIKCYSEVYFLAHTYIDSKLVHFLSFEVHHIHTFITFAEENARIMKESLHIISALCIVAFIVVMTMGFFDSSTTMIIVGMIGFAISLTANVETDDDDYTGTDGGFEYGGW